MQVSEWVCKVLIVGPPDLTHLNASGQCKSSNGSRLSDGAKEIEFARCERQQSKANRQF